MSEIINKIAEIAYRCSHEGTKMTFQQLSNELNNLGFPSDTGRGLAKRVSAAFHRAESENNQGVAKAVANVFTDENGKHYWE